MIFPEIRYPLFPIMHYPCRKSAEAHGPAFVGHIQATAIALSMPVDNYRA
jgi:hypothetical protein